MKKYIEVTNNFKEKFDMGNKIEIVKGTDRGQNIIELENGIWIKDIGDGTLQDIDNKNKVWASILINEYDNNNKFIIGKILGYTEVTK